MTLSNYIETFYKEYLALKRTKPQNLKHDIGTLNTIKSYPISDMELDKIKKIDGEKFLLKIQKDRDVSYTTVNRYRSTLVAIMNNAIDEEVITVNTLRGIRKHKETPRTEVLTNEEIQRLLQSCMLSANKELYTVVALALYSGMRYSEIVFMMKSRLGKNIYTLTAHETKSRKGRDVALPSIAVDILNEFMDANPNDTDRVFTFTHFKNPFHKARLDAGLEHIRFHDLRRTFATHLMETKTPASIIQNQLGHSSLKMTEVYLSGNLEKRVAEIEKLCYK